MPTFAERYCAQKRCAAPSFRHRIFWQTLPWHALPFAPFLLLSDHFEPDRLLIEACARATRLEQVQEEIRDVPFHPRNRSWIRQRARIRISRRRLLALARHYLPQPGKPFTSRQYTV